MKVCSIEGCGGKAQARGWCVMHWNRWRRNGDPERLVVKPPPLYESADAKPGECAVPACDRKIRARGVCATHHQRWRDTGSVNAAEPVKAHGVEPEERFWANVAKRGAEDCWHWTGAVDRTGYGRFDKSLAHRWSCKRFNGPVTDGQHVDHVCHNRDRSCVRGPQCLHRRCVNPAHLEAVAPVTNTHRAYGATEEVCGAGHPRTAANTMVNSTTGRNQCRPCVRETNRNYARRKREGRVTSSRAG